jgi:peptidoglycan/LPS O-acetylase OafA/YrhL
MFQESEVIALVVALVGAFLLIFVFARRDLPQLRHFYAAYFAIAAAAFFTVIEGVLWNDAFNFLEHLSYMLSAVFFILGCRNANRDFGSGEGGG